jgi:regulation of enolase protein 1 (concanavalin A-like superfamily)
LECGQTFTAAAAHAAPATAGPKPTGARPELLDRIPTSFVSSPAMIAVGGAVSLLYGMILFAVVSASRNQAALEPEPEPEPVRAPGRDALATNAPAPIIVPSKKTASPESKSDSSPPAQKPTPAPETKPKQEKKAKKPKKSGSGKSANQPVAVAKAEVAAPEPAPAPAPRIQKWGDLEGPLGDVKFLPDGTGLTLEIPGSPHLLSAELNLKNSPRLLKDVKGDFTAVVLVPGKILPGTQALKKFPFTFQAAGLLVWQDENNYVRLERTSTFFTVEKKRLHQVLIEICKEGKTTSTTLRDAKDNDLTLKLERRGGELRFSFSPDGKTWLEVKRLNVSLPSSVAVGVSASNASPKSFPARLEGFEVSGSSAKASGS